MSYEKVKGFFDRAGLGERVVLRDHIGDTVEHAAEAIGCMPEHIVKTMSFLIDGQPILICMAGDAKVNNTKNKACLLYTSQRQVSVSARASALAKRWRAFRDSQRRRVRSVRP